MSKPYIICFAGVPGCGKSTVAHSLGLTFNLPRFERDVIRNEVKADLMAADINDPAALEEFNKRAGDRFKKQLKSRNSFIMDCSLDRSWGRAKKMIEEAGYSWFLISFDMSERWVKETYKLHNSSHSKFFNRYFANHEKFLEEFAVDVDLEINNENFKSRINISEKAVRDFLATI